MHTTDYIIADTGNFSFLTDAQIRQKCCYLHGDERPIFVLQLKSLYSTSNSRCLQILMCTRVQLNTGGVSPCKFSAEAMTAGFR